MSMVIAGGVKRIGPIDSRGNGGWWPIVGESYPGAWQQNVELRRETVVQYFAVYSCVTLISNDIGKLAWSLRQQDTDGIWEDAAANVPFWGVLKRPNRYQNPIQFRQWWTTSKLLRGNTYALKQRDLRGIVTTLYILDPERCTPMVTEDGSIYYQLAADDLPGIQQAVLVPASEIIHDRMNCLFHPLVGISPLWAAWLTASQGLAMQQDSRTFFGNGARPSGVLTAPGAISDDNAKRMKSYWEEGFTGKNAGKVAVLGDGLKFEPMKSTAVDSQLVEQMELSAEVVCSAFHVPPFKIGIGDLPAGQKVDSLNLIYYSDVLQSLIEEMEQALNDGLSLPSPYGVELNIDGLLRMDTASLYEALGAGVKNIILAPNEARRRVNLPPVSGGDSPLAQQQNFSLEALAKRDAKADPFARAASQVTPAPDSANDPAPPEDTAKVLAMLMEKELARDAA